MTALLVGALAAAAVALGQRPRLARPSPAPAPPRAPVPGDWVRRGRRLWPPLALLAGWAFGGGWGGLVLGVVAAVVVHRVVDAAEPAVVRREREAVRRDLPVLALLLATSLRGGAGLGMAARQVCAALPGAAATRLGVVGDQLALGIDPERVWTMLAADPELAPLGRALARAERTGAPVAAVVQRLADDLATSSRAEVEDRARGVGVRAAVPLGVCLLPAFLLLGIVPLVASLISSIRL
ncbi:MAG: type II secretion system F family protein [Nocardioides sp.]